MSVSIVSTPDLSGYTFYRNKEFDISFSIVTSVPIDASFSFSNSTYGVLPYAGNGRFKSTSGVNALGALGTLSVDVLTASPSIVSTVTPQAYVSANVGCTDPSGNVYFAVANQNKVFQLDLSGGVTTFAGTGTAGDANGDRLTTAQFRAPSSIATDGSGTFFVTDQYRVRKIDSNGLVSTLAGSATRGMADGVGSNASFFSASTVVIRPNGDLLVSDDDSHCIRSVTQAGVVTTYAGLADSPGFQDGQLRPDSNVTTFQGTQAWPFNTTFFSGYETSSGGNGWDVTPFPASPPMAFIQAAIDTPTEILFVGSTSYFGVPFVFIAKSEGTARGPVSFPSGAMTMAYGVATDGAGTYVLGGRVPAVDVQVLRSVDNGSNWVTTGPFLGECRAVAYGGGTWMAAGDPPAASTSNLIYSTDASTWTATGACPISNIYGLAYGGGRWVAVGTGGSTVAYSDNNGVSWTGSTPIAARGNKIAYNAGIWVAGFEEYTSNALYFSTDGATFTETDTNYGGQVTAVYYSAFESRWFASVGTGTILSFDGSQWFTLASPEEASINVYIDVSYTLSTYSNNGARFQFPHGLLYDPSGTLYIADQYNNRIRSIAAGSSNVTTYAGSGLGATSNGTLTTAGMPRPSSLARDSNGTIYVGSFERNTLQTIIGSNVSLLAGAEFTPGYVDGPAASARFNGLGGLATFGNVLYISEIYNGDLRKLMTLPEVRPGVYHPPGYTIVATSNYPITIASRIDVSWTSVGGLLPLYKYEPFSNTFTAKLGGDTLGYSAESSTELAGYLTGAGTANAAFRGPNGANTAYSYSMVLDVQAFDSSGFVVDDVSTTVTISPSRLTVTPCNANLIFYRNEPISPVTFAIVASRASIIYSTTSLPNGLTLTSNTSNSFTLRGTPVIQAISSNFTILGQDTSGRTYSTVVSMAVNPERLILDVSGSTFFGNVVSTTPITPVTLTARFPPYGSLRSMRYTWSQQPPAGLQFRDICGNALSGSSYSIQAVDSSFSLTLAGTITEAQVRAYAAAGTKTTTLSIVGTRTSPLPSLTPSLPTTLTFTMGQVILFDSSISIPFVGIPTLNWSYSAKSYFGTDASITNITVTDGFLPDGLDASFSSNLQRLDISGTPTVASTYAFTLTAVAGSLSATFPVTLSTVNDSVFITTPVDTCFNFIQYRDLSNSKSGYYGFPLTYQARSTSGCNATMTGSGLPDGVTLSVVDASSGTYRLTGRPTTPTGLSTATVSALVPASGATSNKTFQYSVSADYFIFDPSGGTFSFAQNIPISPTQITATTFSENAILRYSSGDLPPALTIANTGLITGTPQGFVDSSFSVTAFTAFSAGSNRYSYSITDDAVLLQPAVYTTVTSPGGNVSIPITGYSLSALTVSNYRFESPFLYGLSINPTTGLLSGTLASSLPEDVSFNLIGSAGLVDGSLGGLMHTDNLTVNRAQLLANQNGTLAVFSSDTNGSNWTQVVNKALTFAYQIGTNGSNVYMIPTSTGAILRSSDGASYTSNVTLGAGSDPRLTAVVNKPGTSTWWVGGTLSNGLGRTVTVFKTTDDGLTWDAGTGVTTNGFTDRAGNPSSYPASNQAYLNGGVELAYKSGVLLLGGNQIVRSTDEGVTWTDASSGLIEISSFSVDHETVWLAAGTSYYLTRQPRAFTPNVPAKTLKYSTDAGLTWSDVTTGGFNMIAYEIQYGQGIWLASGFTRNGNSGATGSVLYSLDGLTWTTVTSIPTTSNAFSGGVASLPSAPLGTYPMALDETEWKVFRVPGDGTVTLYTHQYDLPVDTEWSSMDMTTELSGATSSRYYSYVAQTVDPGADVTTITFPFPNTGPTFISPAQSTYVVWQYMPVPTITFTAAGSGIVYFVSELPVGLVWDAATHSVSGSPMRTGTQTFTVYAKNSGITAFTVTFIVEVPRIVKRQTGAGAYTSLVRQYTEVNAAQAARDSRALPNESRTLGEFASPYPPSVITPSNCPC